MRILSFLLIMLVASSCATKPAPKPVPPLLTIIELHPNRWTALTRQNLDHLMQVYDLKPFLFTNVVHIQSRVIPHSHPVLTLNSRHAEAPNKLLAVFLHEQLHWWLEPKSQEVDLAIKDLKKIYPKLPTAGVASDPHSTYLHLVVCFLEYRALAHYLGKKETTKIFKEIIEVEKVYPWIYTQVLTRYLDLRKIAVKYKLEPAPINAIQKPTKKP